MGKKKKKETTSFEDILTQLNKTSGNIVHKAEDIHRADKISTGSLLLDNVLEGGFVKGKIIECFGGESLGKSALAYSFLAAQGEAIKGFIDGESSYDAETAQMYGVNLKNMAAPQPLYYEDAMEATLILAENGAEAIVFDSVAGIPPKVEYEGDVGDTAVGKKAYRNGVLMRKLHHIANEKGSTVFFINQIRDSMSVYGSSVTTPGGRALKFHASYRMWITGKEVIKVGQEPVGHYMKIRIVKNKFGKPDIRVNVPLIYGHGISPEWEVMELAIEKGILQKAGSWIKKGDTSIAQGLFQTFTMLLDNPEFFEELKKEIFA